MTDKEKLEFRYKFIFNMFNSNTISNGHREIIDYDGLILIPKPTKSENLPFYVNDIAVQYIEDGHIEIIDCSISTKVISITGTYEELRQELELILNKKVEYIEDFFNLTVKEHLEENTGFKNIKVDISKIIGNFTVQDLINFSR